MIVVRGRRKEDGRQGTDHVRQGIQRPRDKEQRRMTGDSGRETRNRDVTGDRGRKTRNRKVRDGRQGTDA